MTYGGRSRKRPAISVFKIIYQFLIMFTNYFLIRKHITIVVMVVAMFFGMTMSVAHAQTPTVSELQTLITKLTEQINALKNESGTGTSVVKPAPTTNNGTCVSPFTRQLQLGSSDATTGGDVTRLQSYLASTGHFTYGKPTGFYGPATAEAVKRWQVEQGIVSSGTPETTGYGAFGPTTRAKLSAQCVAVSQTEPAKTSPALSTFTTTVDDLRAVVKFSLPNGCAGYVINWGDGNKTTRAAAAAGTACTQAIQNVTQAHTYRNAGSYTVTVETYAGTSLRSTSSKSVTVGASSGTDSCMNGGVSYPEGTKRNSLDGVPFVADIGYVCEDGAWKSENGLARPVEPTPSTACLIGRVSYPEGTTRTGAMQPDGTWLLIADISSVCENGKWVPKNTYPLPPPPATGCTFEGRSYVEGAERTVAITSSQPLPAGMYYVCRNGEWKIEGELPPPTYPLPTCTLSASRTSVLAGTTSRLTWTSTNTGTTRATLTGFAPDTINPRNTTGYRDVKPTTSTTYTLTVKNDAGQTATCSVRISVSMSGVRGAATSSLEHELTKLVTSLEAFVATLH